ncbi:MAG: UDP-N-acetylmuramate dehydrogenase [Bacteroidaceae bacterium]
MTSISYNISLKKYNTFGIDVPAKCLIEYDSIDDLHQILSNKENYPSPFLPIGEGSNLLFSKPYEGTILHSRILGIQEIERNKQTVTLRVGAGVLWDDFVAYCVDHEYYGAENLSHIPGEVGASAVQNIGAYGAEVSQLIRKVQTYSLDTNDLKSWTNEACQYAYRKSIFKIPEIKGHYIVTYVDYQLSLIRDIRLDYGAIRSQLISMGCENSEEANISSIREAIISIRQKKLPDPKEIGNAGSFFVNPIVSEEQYHRLLSKFPSIPSYRIDARNVKIPAGWMIEQIGWKGKSIGHVGVYKDQALVLVNLGGASAQEIIDLCQLLIDKVEEKFGITIYPEVNII